MSIPEQMFLGLVVGGLAVFALTLGYQSFAEWRDVTRRRRHG